MSGEELVDRFEALTLEPAELGHEQHVQLAWELLRRAPLHEAAARLITGLKRFTRHNGAESKYHETITWSWLLTIHDRMQRRAAGDFADFREQNVDLFTRAGILLAQLYEPETLASELARTTYLLPDRRGDSP